VTPVNDPPTANDDTGSTDEDTTLSVSSPGLLSNDTDPDLPSDTQTVVKLNGSTTLTGTSSKGAAVTVNANGSYTYKPGAIFQHLAAGATDTDTFTYTVRDSGNAESTATVTITITGRNDAPTANADTYNGADSAIGNTVLGVSTNPSGPAKTITGSVKTNDTDVDDGNTVTTVAETLTSANGGSVTMNADGSFTYLPPQGFTGNDSFTYHATDGTATSNGTLTIAVANLVWYVDNSKAAAGDGRSSSPFNTLAPLSPGGAADSKDGNGDRIFLYKGSGNYTGGLVLEANQQLIGAAQTLAVAGTTLVTGNSANRPTLTNGSGAGATLASGSTVTGLLISGSSGAAISGTNTGGSTVNDVTVAGANGGINLNGASGTFTITNTPITTTGGTAFFVNGAGGPGLTLTASTNDSVSATGGSGLDVRNVTGSSSLAFDSVSASGGAFGVNLDTIGATTASLGTGTLTGSSADFKVNGGSGAISYSGALGDGTGLSADIGGRTAGAIALSGNVSDSNDAGGGINFASNTGGSTTFSGAVSLNTGAGNAVSSTGSGHTMTFSGGLTIAATTGSGFSTTGGGTVTVTGSTNTIATTTGTALNVANTTIGTNGLTFRSIASNGAASGIILNATGSTAGLTVTGNSGTCTSAATCTGGAIQNSTGPGINLTSVGGGVSLTRVSVNNGGDDGIRGSTVNGLTLDNSRVVSNGNDPLAGTAPDGEHGVDFRDLTGTATFTNSNVSNNSNSNVVVSNASGVLNMNVTGGTYSGATGGMGDGIYVGGTGTGSQNLNVQGPITFSNNVGDHIQHTSDAANTTDSDVTINNATMTSPAAAGGGPTCALNILGGGIVINHGGDSNVDATVTNNNIQNACIGAIAVDTAGSVSDQQNAHIDATIQNNVIGTAGVAGSGAVQGNGIFVSSNGNGLVRTLITGNTIRQWTNRNGIELDVDDGDAEMDATVRGNLLTEPNSAFAGTTTRGMTLQLGAQQAGDSIDACLDIGHATDTTQKNTLTDTGESPQPDVRYLHEGPGSVVQLVGFSGSANQTDITNWFTSRNIFGPTPTVSGTFTAPGGSTTSSVASCPQPAP
jgi:VCBS repeat-containing protein